jgi:CubicO group peptidase (beta-lactamase class C family)
VLLGAIIEKVEGKDWHAAVRDRISAPLGLTTIRYGEEESSVPQMASGYTRGEKGIVPARTIHMSVPHAAGALIGTVGDLARWNQALHHGRIVQGANYTAMIAPTKMPGGKEEAYGYGLVPGKLRGKAAVGHGGGIFGFTTDSVYLPEEDMFVAVFTNTDSPAVPPSVVMQRLAAMAIGKPFPVFAEAKLDLAAVEPLLGVYRGGGEGSERLFYARDGQLYTRRGDAPEAKVYAAGDDRFFYGGGSLAWFRLKRAAGGAHVMEMHQDGSDEAETAKRTGPVPPPPAGVAVARDTLQRYVGTYSVHGSKVGITMAETGGLVVHAPGDTPRPLRAMSATEFDVDGIGARITFHQAADAVTHFLVRMQSGQELKGDRLAE